MGRVQLPGPSISLRLFGFFTVTSASSGQPIHISSIKARGLLAFLAMHPGQEFSRSELSKLLWSGSSGEGRHNLRQCKLALQNDLKNEGADLFISCRDTIGIRAGAISVDVIEFERLANSGDIEAAAELCEGDFLASGAPQTEEFIEWVSRQQARLSLIGVSVFGSLARYYDMHGRGALAIRAAQRLVKFDVYREDSQRLLIELYARYNGRSVAIEHGERFSRMLSRELDVDVEPATRALIEAIRRGNLFASLAVNAA
mgnify:CR=1 FL=1